MSSLISFRGMRGVHGSIGGGHAGAGLFHPSGGDRIGGSGGIHMGGGGGYGPAAHNGTFHPDIPGRGGAGTYRPSRPWGPPAHNPNWPPRPLPGPGPGPRPWPPGPHPWRPYGPGGGGWNPDWRHPYGPYWNPGITYSGDTVVFNTTANLCDTAQCNSLASLPGSQGTCCPGGMCSQGVTTLDRYGNAMNTGVCVPSQQLVPNVLPMWGPTPVLF